MRLELHWHQLTNFLTIIYMLLLLFRNYDSCVLEIMWNSEARATKPVIIQFRTLRMAVAEVRTLEI